MRLAVYVFSGKPYLLIVLMPLQEHNFSIQLWEFCRVHLTLNLTWDIAYGMRLRERGFKKILKNVFYKLPISFIAIGARENYVPYMFVTFEFGSRGNVYVTLSSLKSLQSPENYTFRFWLVLFYMLFGMNDICYFTTYINVLCYFLENN